MQVNPKENAVTIRQEIKSRQSTKSQETKSRAKSISKPLSIQEQMMMDAMQASSLRDSDISTNLVSPIDIANIVKRTPAPCTTQSVFDFEKPNSGLVTELS
jgi:cytochrome oxidase assembly protein ShyY1